MSGPFGLDGRTALVTGANRGLGRAFAQALAEAGADVVLVGNGEDEVTLPIRQIQNREVVLTGIFRYVDTWPRAIGLAAGKQVDLDALVTATFPLEEVEAALTSDDDPMSMKSVVVVNGAR